MDKEEDSRTAAVGRKRDFGAMEVETEQENCALSPGEDTHSHKRVNRTGLITGDEMIYYEPPTELETSHTPIAQARDLASTLPLPAEAIASLTQTQPMAQSTEQVDPVISRPVWNRSAQTGVTRTSFGNKHKNLLKHFEVGEMAESSLDNNLEDEMPPISQATLDGKSEKAIVVSSHNDESKSSAKLPIDDSSSLSSMDSMVDDSMVDEPQSSYYEAKEAASVTSDASLAVSTPISSLPSKKGPAKQANPPKPPAKVIHKCGGGNITLPRMLVDNNPVGIEDLRIEDFLAHITKVNSNKVVPKISRKHMRTAFAKYIDSYYLPSPISEAQKLAVNTNPSEHVQQLLDQAVQTLRKEPPGPGKKARSSQRANQLQNFNSTANDPQLLQSSQKSQSHQLPLPRALLSVVERVGHLPNTEVVMSDSPIPADDTTAGNGLERISKREAELLGKYFPPVCGVVTKLRCLACAETTHSTIDCPAFSCTACGGNHTTDQCEKHRLCLRCRQRGHSGPECVEKLIPNLDELTCDLCGSSSHIEMDCQLVWRSFVAKPSEIKPLLIVPVYCYYCGGQGHYGGECGLNHEVSSSGIWSRSNRLIVSPAINAPKKKDFSIKGKANDPITLDDSGDDTAFIRPKINNPPVNQRRDYGPGSGNHMSLDNNARSAVPPPESYDWKIDFQRALPTGPKQTNSGFAFGGGGNSARYVGESAFPPPPSHGPQPTGSSHQRGPPPLVHMAPGSNARDGHSGRGSRGGPRGRGRGGASRGSRGGNNANANVNANANGGRSKKKMKAPKAGKNV